MLAARLGLGPQGATPGDAPVRWAWSGGVTSRGAVVKARTPDANIRVDLLAIWAVLALVSLCALYRALR